MTDLTTTVSTGQTGDLAYDDSRSLLYFGLQRWDPQAGAFLTPISLGGGLEFGEDVTPDDNFLIVSGQASTSQVIDRINLSTLVVEQFTIGSTSTTGSLDAVAVAANGQGLAVVGQFASTPAHLIEFGSEAGAITAGSVTGATSGGALTGTSANLFVSADRRFVLVDDGSTAPGSEAIELYDSNADAVVASTSIPQLGANGFPSLAAVSGSARLVFFRGYVLDTGLHLVKDLTGLNTFTAHANTIAGVEFSGDGHLLFLWNRQLAAVQAYDTSSWQLVGQIAGVIAPFLPSGSVGGMAVSGDGRFLFLDTDAYLQTIDLSARLRLTVQGDATHTQLNGAAGADLLIGGNDDAVITGQGGADIFRITSGAATATVADFSHAQGDRIDLSAFAGFINLASVTAAAHQSGPDTVISLGSGSVTLSSVTLASLTVQDFVFHKGASDFAQSGADALLFRNAATGDWGFMQASGPGGQTWHSIGSTSTDYAAIGRGDFNGDGVLDTAFRHTSTGAWGYLTIGPTGGQTWHPVGPSSLAYAAVATGDILHTGSSDVVFRNPTTGDWGFMSTSADGSEAWHPIGSTSTDYAAIGSGDFNGDGTFDVAFRQVSTGAWGYLSIPSSGGEVWHPVGPTSLSYDAVASADFLGAGKTEIAFRNVATGDWGFMETTADNAETWHAIGPSSTDYAAMGAGDFNGDGVQDVAFRNTSTGDWGFMTVNPGGGETWHGVGSASLAYGAI
jgi:hypothetical protein